MSIFGSLVALVAIILGWRVISKAVEIWDFIRSFLEACMKELSKGASEAEAYNKWFTFASLFVAATVCVLGIYLATPVNTTTVIILGITSFLVFAVLFFASPLMTLNIDRKKNLFRQ